MWLLLAACAHVPRADPVAVPAPPPLATIDEADLRRLVEAPGQVTVINVWASWCGPCRAELPTVDALAEGYPSVRFLLLDVDEAAQAAAAAGLAAGLRTPAVRLDPGAAGDLAVVLRRTIPEWADTIPHTVVLDASGAVRKSFKGAASRSELEGAIRTAAAGSP